MEKNRRVSSKDIAVEVEQASCLNLFIDEVILSAVLIFNVVCWNQ